MGNEASDSAWVRDLSVQLSGLDSRRGIIDTVTTVVGARLRSEVTTYNELTMGGPTTQMPVQDEGMIGELLGRLDQHPLFEPVIQSSSSGPVAPVQMSDVLSVRLWRSHPIYTDLLKPRAVPLHTLCVPVTGNQHGDLEWYQFNRDGYFSRRDMELLTRLQPVLIALTRRTPTKTTCSPEQHQLTPREIEILGCIAQGMTVTATAHRLAIAPATARKHLEHIHAKLDTHGPVATLRRAVELGIIDP